MVTKKRNGLERNVVTKRVDSGMQKRMIRTVIQYVYIYIIGAKFRTFCEATKFRSY